MADPVTSSVTPTSTKESVGFTHALQNLLVRKVKREPISFELGDVSKLPLPKTSLKLKPEEAKVFSWLQQNQMYINKYGKQFNINPTAVAGAIAWEALYNLEMLSVHGIGPGKQHENVLRTPTFLKTLKEYGFQHPYDIKNSDERAIRNIAVTMRAGADKLKQQGFSVNDEKLLQIYNGANLEHLNGDVIPHSPMSMWVKQNQKFLQESVGQQTSQKNNFPQIIPLSSHQKQQLQQPQIKIGNLWDTKGIQLPQQQTHQQQLPLVTQVQAPLPLHTPQVLHVNQQSEGVVLPSSLHLSNLFPQLPQQKMKQPQLAISGFGDNYQHQSRQDLILDKSGNLMTKPLTTMLETKQQIPLKVIKQSQKSISTGYVGTNVKLNPIEGLKQFGTKVKERILGDVDYDRLQTTADYLGVKTPLSQHKETVGEQKVKQFAVAQDNLYNTKLFKKMDRPHQDAARGKVYDKIVLPFYQKFGMWAPTRQDYVNSHVGPTDLKVAPNFVAQVQKAETAFGVGTGEMIRNVLTIGGTQPELGLGLGKFDDTWLGKHLQQQENYLGTHVEDGMMNNLVYSAFREYIGKLPLWAVAEGAAAKAIEAAPAITGLGWLDTLKAGSKPAQLLHHSIQQALVGYVAELSQTNSQPSALKAALGFAAWPWAAAGVGGVVKAPVKLLAKLFGAGGAKVVQQVVDEGVKTVEAQPVEGQTESIAIHNLQELAKQPDVKLSQFLNSTTAYLLNTMAREQHGVSGYNLLTPELKQAVLARLGVDLHTATRQVTAHSPVAVIQQVAGSIQEQVKTNPKFASFIQELQQATGRPVETGVAQQVVQNAQARVANTAEAGLEHVHAATQNFTRIPAVTDAELATHLYPQSTKLPQELAGAKPRYGFGNKLFELTFDSDVDRALYTVAKDEPRSKQDAKYMAWLKKQFPSKTDEQIRGMGREVRGRIKQQARVSEPENGPLKITTTQRVGSSVGAARAGSSEFTEGLLRLFNAKFDSAKGWRVVEGTRNKLLLLLGSVEAKGDKQLQDVLMHYLRADVSFNFKSPLTGKQITASDKTIQRVALDVQNKYLAILPQVGDTRGLFASSFRNINVNEVGKTVSFGYTSQWDRELAVELEHWHNLQLQGKWNEAARFLKDKGIVEKANMPGGVSGGSGVINDIFDKTQTGMPKYDDMLQKPQLAEYFRKSKHRDWKVIEMDPHKYIDEAAAGFAKESKSSFILERAKILQSRTDLSRIDSYVKAGNKLPMLTLTYGKDNSFTQEGIHRALYAIEHGIEKVPVLISTEDDIPVETILRTF